MKPIFNKATSKSIIPLLRDEYSQVFNNSGRPTEKVHVNGASSLSMPNELLNLSKILAFYRLAKCFKPGMLLKHPLNASVIWFNRLSGAGKTMGAGELKVNLILEKLL